MTNEHAPAPLPMGPHNLICAKCQKNFPREDKPVMYCPQCLWTFQQTASARLATQKEEEKTKDKARSEWLQKEEKKYEEWNSNNDTHTPA